MIVCSRRRRQIPAIRYVARVRDQREEKQNERHNKQRKARPEQLFILGVQDESIPRRPRVLELHHRRTRKQTRNHKRQLPNVASRVMYFLTTCVHDHMLSHICDAKTPKEAWENLKKIFAADTSAQASTPAIVKQHTPKRNVCDGLHRQDQEHL